MNQKMAVPELLAIFDHAPVGIVFVRDGLLQHCNRQFCELLGYAEDEVSGQRAPASSTRARPTMSACASGRGRRCWPAIPSMSNCRCAGVTAACSTAGCMRRRSIAITPVAARSGLSKISKSRRILTSCG